MSLEIKKFNELTTLELYEILKVRSKVFVVEQKLSYVDPDGKDIDSVHVMIKENNKVIAYLRLIKPGVSYNDPSIGRVLVIPEARNKGLARKLVKAGIDYIINNWNEKKITIGAQNYLRSFYESMGFKANSKVYLEVMIPHIKMTYKKIE